MKKPAVFYSGNTVVRAGNIVGVQGEYLDQEWNAVLSDGVRTEPVELLQQNRQSFKLQIPDGFADGIYTLTLSGNQPLTITFNEPKVRWMRGDEGEAATPGGWVRMQGECMRIRSDVTPYAMLASDDNTVTRIFPDRVYDDYSVGFSLAGIREGHYRVTYSNGFSPCDCGSLTVAPSPEDSWRKEVYDVTEYGLSRDSVIDCTEALKALLEKAGSEGGGILYFPAGRYHLTGSFHIPSGVVLRGDGYRYTQLFWTDHWRQNGVHENGTSREWMADELPEVMITADGNFAIEDLEFAAGRIGRLLRAGTPGHPVKNVRLDRVRVNVNALSGVNGRHHQKQCCAVLKETWHIWDENELDMLEIEGSNVKIRDCNFDWSGRLTSYAYHLNYFLFQNIYMGNVNSTRYWMPLGLMDKAIIEDCEVHGWNLGCGGENVYMARMQVQDNICGDREAFSTDITSGINYAGKAVIDGCRFTFPDDVDLSGVRPGAKLCILSGTGAGQFRYVTNVEGQTVSIQEPFEAEPDETSDMTVNYMFINWYFCDFTIDNCGMLQFYVAQGNTVVDGVKTTRSAGIKGYGQYTYKGIQNHWYCSYINNELSEGNCYHREGWFDYHDNMEGKPGGRTAYRLPGYSFLYMIGRCSGLINLGCTVRGNILRDNCLLYIRSAAKGSIRDLIVDSNHSEDCRCGIYIEGEPESMLLSGNTVSRVEEAVHYEKSHGVCSGQIW